ncbi:MAG: type I-B CRISPR-associated protein Cas7/Csh2 [Thermotogaceae bacterium]|nr:type I-B CRISPR-associated protein Cas7/Csh2 [Thermotogaceae bacterium]
MMFNKRREILFLYSVKDANPNGDPLNANHPRYDEETGQIMTSDVRVKRTTRDEWILEGEEVLVNGEAVTLPARYDELKKKYGESNAETVVSHCIDARVFGATFAVGKESFSWTGPVQFKWGRSLHRAKVEFVQGTAAFATKDTSEQRSFRNEYIVPFALMATSAVCNQNASRYSGATEEDLTKLSKALWYGTKNLITRSKMEHTPALLIEITYKEGHSSHIGSLDERVVLCKTDGSAFSDEEQYKLRSLKDFVIDLSSLQSKIDEQSDHIDSVSVIINSDVRVKGIQQEPELR